MQHWLAYRDMSCAMMNTANVPRAIRYKLFGKILKTATKLDSLVLVEINWAKKMRVKYYANVIPNWVKFVRTFGEAGTVRTGKYGKVCNDGVTII